MYPTCGRPNLTNGTFLVPYAIHVIPRPLTWLLVLFATLLLPLAVLSAWTAAIVEDTDTYVDTVGPLADDPVVTEAVAARLTAASLAALGAPFNENTGVQVAVRRGVARVVGGPEFPPAWTTANRVLHQELVKILSSEYLPAGETVRIDLAPLADEVMTSLQSEGLPARVNLSGRDLTIEIAPTDELEQARWAWAVTTTLGYWLPIIWGALVLLILVSARRKLAAVGEVAIGALVGLGLLWGALLVGRGIVLESSPEIADTLWDTVFSSLVSTIQIGLVAAVVVLVLRIAIGLGRRPRST